jgi:hypothetical protein
MGFMSDRVRGLRRRRAARMIFGHVRSGMIVMRRRRILARKTVARANERNRARDDGAEKRQKDDGFVHCRLAPVRFPDAVQREAVHR